MPAESKIVDLDNVPEVRDVEEVVIEYYTEAPQAFEEEIAKGKKITITGPDELNYTDILAYTELDNEVPVDKAHRIRFYWHNNETGDLFRQPLEFEHFDLDEDGFIDYIEWVVPHLSNQTYEIIIITAAEHLDSNKIMVSDIYNETIEQDDVWSEKIYHGEYIRVTFEENLTSEKDITIYPRNNQSLNTFVEVYYYNSSEKITEFPIINETRYYKIYLTEMNRSYDTFDLKIVNEQNDSNAYLEFDHIIDPSFVIGNEAHDIDIAILDDDTGMFVMAWCDDSDDSARYQVLYTNGTAYSDVNEFDGYAGDSCRISVSALNNTAFVIAYADWSDYSIIV
jgi:hypothetical protein